MRIWRGLATLGGVLGWRINADCEARGGEAEEFKEFVRRERALAKERVIKSCGAEVASNVWYIPCSPEDPKCYYLIGTHHKVQGTQNQASRVIEAVRPNSVVLEISQDYPRPITSSLMLLKNGFPYASLVSLLLARKKWHIAPTEIVLAMETARKVSCQEIIYADSPWHIRTERFFNFEKSVGPIFHLMTQQHVSDSKISTLATQIYMDREKERKRQKGKSFVCSGVGFHVTNVFERDILFIHRLQKARGPVVVGVFGEGHIEGILDFWDNPNVPHLANTILSKEKSIKASIETWLSVHPLPPLSLMANGGIGYSPVYENGNKIRDGQSRFVDYD